MIRTVGDKRNHQLGHLRSCYIVVQNANISRDAAQSLNYVTSGPYKFIMSYHT